MIIISRLLDRTDRSVMSDKIAHLPMPQDRRTAERWEQLVLRGTAPAYDQKGNVTWPATWAWGRNATSQSQNERSHS